MYLHILVVFIYKRIPSALSWEHFGDGRGVGSERKNCTKVDSMMYVPVLRTIQNLLKSDTIVSEVRVPTQ